MHSKRLMTRKCRGWTKCFPSFAPRPPFLYSAQVILYNVNQVKTPPTAYADLWDPKWRGKVGLVDILYLANTLAAALKSEEVWLTTMWLARGFMWKKAGIPLSHVVPKEGAASIIFEASVPRNARNKEAGFTYLDAMLDPKAQVAFADKMGYVPTVSDAVLPEDIAGQVALGEGDRAKLLQPDYKYQAERSQRTLDFWNKQFKG